MMMTKKFSLAARLKSFSYAFAGIKAVLGTEQNTWIHLFLTIAAIIGGFLCRLEITEWMALVIVFGMVWVAELFNTAIEKTIDFISTEKHPQIKMIKDIAAAAVLVAAIAAFGVGCLLFIPKIF